MPSLDEILSQTMLLTAAPKGWVADPLPPWSSLRAGEPNPTVSQDHEIRKRNPVWSWEHPAADPTAVIKIRSKVLGMGMNYSHSMPVCEQIRLDEVQIIPKIVVPKREQTIVLPLTSSYVMRKYYLREGFIPDSGSGLWRLETQVDQSMLVVFGYKLIDANPSPLTEQEASTTVLET